MHGAKPQAAINALNIRCSTDARATLEQLLGPPTAIVEIGEADICLGYRLTAPVANGDGLKKYKEAREYAARLAGGPLNGRIDRKRCRVISRDPDIEVDLDTARHILWQAALTKALLAYGPDESTESKQPAHGLRHRNLTTVRSKAIARW